MSITPGSPYDESRDYTGDQPPVDRRPRRRIPLRFRFLIVVVALVLLARATTDVRRGWAHRVHDITGGSRPADYVIGLVVGLLPLIGVGIGAFGGKDSTGRRRRRVLRMVGLGALGFIVTDLLAPTLGRYLTDQATVRVFDQVAPNYLAGALTAAGVWLALLVFGIVRARAWWHRVTRRGMRPPDHGAGGDGPKPRIIDI